MEQNANNIQINFNGFSTRVEFENQQVSAVSINASSSENIINTEAFFGGEKNLSDGYFRLGQQGFYELPNISANLTIEPSFEQLNPLFFNIIKSERTTGKSLDIYAANNKTFNFNKSCYIQSMSIGTSENQLLTADYSFYINEASFFDTSINSNVEKKYNSRPIWDMVDFKNTPIGYWETTIDGFNFGEGMKTQILSWKLNYQQNVIPKFYLSKETVISKTPNLPIIWVSHPSMSLDVSFIVDKNDFSYDKFCTLFDEKTNPEKPDSQYNHHPETNNETGNSLFISIRGKKFIELQYGKITSVSPSLSSNSAVTVNVNYQINAIDIPSN